MAALLIVQSDGDSSPARNVLPPVCVILARLDYCPSTGVFKWVSNGRGRAFKGKEAGSEHANGYRQIRINYTKYLAHRLAFWLIHGEQPLVVDHIDGNPRNNAISNLQAISSSENLMRRHRPRADTTTGYRGVCQISESIWRAMIFQTVIGYYSSPEEAGRAYEVARMKEMSCVPMPETAKLWNDRKWVEGRADGN